MLKILHFALSIIVIVIAVYSLMTDDFTYQLIMMFSLSGLMLVMGLRELQRNKKATGWFLMVTFSFLLFVSFASI
ncbi:YczI family protein [Bacillus sp. AGMB 02131]|uniref:YczI family protein n=1 Tax=Peribacillus faecalis TaxID=2772559 RepID=A0A927CXJ9_9BACI|nr:YczI family protein [Peribacillus faecalis]